MRADALPENGERGPKLQGPYTVIRALERLYTRERPARKHWKHNAHYTARCLFIYSKSAIIIVGQKVNLDNPIDYSLKKTLVVFNFSRSWVSIYNLLCLDPFKKKLKTFEERRDTELDGVRRMVLLYSYLHLGQG